jgi:hypothetical protein
MRRLYGLRILPATALLCQTVHGREGKTCQLRGLHRGEFATHAVNNPGAADAHALRCKCGAGVIVTHDLVRAAPVAVAQEWQVLLRMEGNRLLRAANARMDNDAPLGGDPGTHGLMIDWTGRAGVGQAGLIRAERGKEMKYFDAFTLPVTMKGAAFNDMGELGPGALDVVDRLVQMGARSTGAHPDDLRMELLARIGVAVHSGNAAAFAYFARANGVWMHTTPRAEALRPSGMVRATGVTGQLARRGRGRPRGSKARVAPAAAGGAGGVVAPQTSVMRSAGGAAMYSGNVEASGAARGGVCGGAAANVDDVASV